MTAIIALLALLAAALFVRCCVCANRAANLEYLLDTERAIACELAAQLDDAQRNAAYWQQRTDSLVQENNTLAVDLHFTQERNVWLESIHMARKGETAGVKLLCGRTNMQAKMQVRVLP